MRVVVTCDWFVKYAAAQAAGLARAGADVLLLCRDHALEFGGDERERQACLDSARRDGVSVLDLPRRQSDVRALPALAGLAIRLRRWRPDVVHAHDGADPRAAVLLAGLPTVLTVHDPVPHPGQPVADVHKRWFLQGFRGIWRARARAIVVHSDALIPETRLGPQQRCVVIPHGIATAREPLVAPSAPTVGFFGRLTPYKGLDVLAAAMPAVWATRPETRLRVAGSGEEPLTLRDARVAVERRYLPEHEIPGFLAGATLAVLPYTQASQTGVGSVAAGYGVPIVASRVGGLPDLVLDDSYLATPGDSGSLAAAILRHLDDGPEVRRRVLADVAGPRSWDAVAGRAIEIYEQILRRR